MFPCNTCRPRSEICSSPCEPEAGDLLVLLSNCVTSLLSDYYARSSMRLGGYTK